MACHPKGDKQLTEQLTEPMLIKITDPYGITQTYFKYLKKFMPAWLGPKELKAGAQLHYLGTFCWLKPKRCTSTADKSMA